MAVIVQESFNALPFAANATGAVISGSAVGLGGFLCTASGSLKLTTGSGAGPTIVDTCPVTAGVFLPLPFSFPPGTVVFATLTGGAAGTFAAL